MIFLVVACSMPPGASLCFAGPAREEVVRTFQVPEGKASETLKSIARQGGVEIIFLAEAVDGVRTPALNGSFTVTEALRRVLAHTHLVVVPDEKNELLIVRSRNAPSTEADAGSAPHQQHPSALHAPLSQTNNPEKPTPMNRKTPNALRSIATALFSLVAANGQAPETPKESTAAEEEMITLSPFTVSAERDEGYVARETLSGSRLNTSLRDVSSQVNVMTAEFLQDIGVTSLDDALGYSLNVESYNEAMDVNVEQVIGDSLHRSATSTGRTRGLVGSNRSHDFFETALPVDTYNTERITFSSGPNAILFGNSSPTGTIDTTFKRALLSKSSRTIETRVDSEGSWRGSLDLNQVIVPSRLAVRIAGMKERREDFRKPAFEKQDRIYATATLQPMDRVSLRAWFEEADRFRQPQTNTLIQDRVSPWIRAGRPVFNNAVGQPLPTSTSSPHFVPYANASRPLYSYDANGLAWPAGMVSRPYVNPGIVEARGDDTILPSPDNYDGSLIDPSIFPADVAYSGNASQNQTNGWIRGIAAEINPIKNLHIELAANEEDLDYRSTFYLSGQNTELNVDPNQFMPDGVTPNPYVGRYYMDTAPIGNVTSSSRNDWRAAISYELDFGQRSKQLRWLGRHRAAFLTSESKSIDLSQVLQMRLASNHPYTSGTTPNSFNHVSRQIWFRYYVSDPTRPETGGDFRFNVPFDPFTPGVLPGTDMEVALFDHPMGASQPTVGSRVNVASRVLALQNFLWNDRIVTTFGWRKDEVEIDTVILASQQPRLGSGSEAPYLHLDDFVGEVGGSMWNRVNADRPSTALKGVVFHATPWLSLFFNRSNTDQVPANVRQELTGETSRLADGEGDEYGIALSLFSGKLNVRLNRYENRSTGALSVFRGATPTPGIAGANNLRDNIYHLERTVFLHEQAFDEKYRFYQELILQNTPGSANQYRDRVDVLADSEAEGYEVTVVGSPLARTTVSFTVAQTETSEYNIGTPWFDLIQARLPVWSRHLNRSLHNNANVSISQYLQSTVQNWNYIRMANGQPTFQQRKHRVNFTVRHTLDGRLRGGFIGGHLRWLSPASIGFPNIAVADNPFEVPGVAGATLTVPDVSNPYRGDTESTVDVFGGFTRSIFDRKVRWRLQLNVRNALNDRDLRVQRSRSSGEGSVFRLPTPRAFILTNSFSF